MNKGIKGCVLARSAYNGGTSKVYRAIRQSGSRNFSEWQYYLPEESRNHLKKFIATHYVIESGDDNNSGNIDYTTLKSGNTFKSTLSQKDAGNTEELNISGKYNSVIIAKNLSIDITEFNRLNPGFDMVMS